MEYYKITENNQYSTSELLKLCKAELDVTCKYSDVELDTKFPIKNTTRYFKVWNKRCAEDEMTADMKTTLDDTWIREQSITLRERLLLELYSIKYFNRTLEAHPKTLCLGSVLDERCPVVLLSNGKMTIEESSVNALGGFSIFKSITLDSVIRSEIKNIFNECRDIPKRDIFNLLSLLQNKKFLNEKGDTLVEDCFKEIMKSCE